MSSRLEKLKTVQISLSNEGGARTFDVLYFIEGESSKVIEDFHGDDRIVLESMEFQISNLFQELDEYVEQEGKVS